MYLVFFDGLPLDYHICIFDSYRIFLFSWKFFYLDYFDLYFLLKNFFKLQRSKKKKNIKLWIRQISLDNINSTFENVKC